jgi:hypothetical protein
MEQVILRVEILVNRAVRQICLFGDVGDRRGVKSAAREYFFAAAMISSRRCNLASSLTAGRLRVRASSLTVHQLV